MKDQAGEEQDVGVRKADLELDGLHEIEDGRPGHQKPVPVLGESSVGEMTDAGDLWNKKTPRWCHNFGLNDSASNGPLTTDLQ